MHRRAGSRDRRVPLALPLARCFAISAASCLCLAQYYERSAQGSLHLLQEQGFGLSKSIFINSICELVFIFFSCAFGDRRVTLSPGTVVFI